MSDKVEYALEYDIKPHFKEDDYAGTTFQLNDASGNPINLTGIEIKAYWWKNNKDSAPWKSPTIGSGITIINAALGEFKLDGFKLEELDTCSKLIYLVRVKINDDSKTRAFGEMILK